MAQVLTQEDRKRILLQLRRIQEELIHMISTPTFPVVVESRMVEIKGQHGYMFRIQPENELYKIRVVVNDLHYTDEQLLIEMFNKYERKVNRG